jgi:hypothetical protein
VSSSPAEWGGGEHLEVRFGCFLASRHSAETRMSAIVHCIKLFRSAGALLSVLELGGR